MATNRSLALGASFGFAALAAVIVALVMVVAPQPAQAQTRSLCPILSYGITFQPITVVPRSFFTSQGQSLVVTRGKPFPRVIVRAVDSNGDFDPTTNNVAVVASSTDPGVTVDPSTATAIMYNGEAHFTNLTIMNGDTLTLNFTAISDELQRRVNNSIQRYRLPLHLKYLHTGILMVERTEQPQFALQFLDVSSWVQYPDMPATVVSGVPLPAIRLQVVTSAYVQYLPLQGLANNFSVILGFASAPPPGTTISGTLQPIVSGYATFDSIVITTTAATLPPLQFTLAASNLQTQTGPLTVDILRDNAHIDFDPASVSFIYTQGQRFSGMFGTPLPPIQISVRNNMYQPSTPQSGLVITASCARAPVSNNVAGVVDGVAIFDSLLFYGPTHQEFRPYVLTFTAGTQNGFAGESIFTGIIDMSAVSYPAYRFRFVPGVTDAFFNAMFQPVQVVKDNVLTPPLRAELLNSDNSRDTVTTGLGLTVAVENGKFASTLTTLPFTQGVAQSLDFRFTATSVAGSYTVLSLTSTTDPTKRLVTGRINVTNPVSNYNLRFQPYGSGLFSAQKQANFATIGIALPPIVVELITSANTLDTSSNDITITASAVGATLTGSFVRVANGVAVFNSLTFVSDVTGAFKITFTAGDAGGAPVGGKSIITGDVALYAAVTPNVFPRFRNDSFIYFTGQSRPITIDVPMGSIIVELATSDHTPAQRVNGTAAKIVASISFSNGGPPAGTPMTSLPVVDGVVTLSNLRLTTGLDPVLTICFRSTIQSGTPPPADGTCISTGPLTTNTKPPNPIGFLNLYQPLTTLPADGNIAKGQLLRVAVSLFDVSGAVSPQTQVDVEVTTSVSVTGTTRVPYNVTHVPPVAMFTDLSFTTDFGAGVAPILTFTLQPSLGGSVTASQLLGILPIASTLLTIQGASANSGVDVVAEILADTLTFSPTLWIAAAAMRLNMEPARILQIRVDKGESADPDPNGITQDNTVRTPSWFGTRFNMRFLPPLATSRDTRTATDLANLFVSLVPSCKIGELKLRKAYLLADDTSCDWYIFDAQLQSVQQCIQSKGQPGFCDCHVPLFAFMGQRCLGLPRMTTLCLNVLINVNAANCQQPAITSVCQQLVFPAAPRTGVAASGAALFLCFIPLMYLYNSGFFAKINLPTAEQSRITKMPFVASDERDML